jgi:hypothetical protein
MPALRRALCCAALLGAALSALAQTLDETGMETAIEQYAVELIVFRHENAPPPPEFLPEALPESSSDEFPDDDESAPSFGDTGAAAAPAPGAEPERPAEAIRRTPLAEDALELTELEARLAGLGAYAPLVHTGWIQDSYPIGEAAAFDIVSAEHPELEGTVRFSRGRYLHLELDLSYRPPALAAAEPGWDGFKVSEDRRLRDGELHYFDNPWFGVIARVTSWPPEAREDAPPPLSLNAPR